MAEENPFLAPLGDDSIVEIESAHSVCGIVSIVLSVVFCLLMAIASSMLAGSTEFSIMWIAPLMFFLVPFSGLVWLAAIVAALLAFMRGETPRTSWTACLLFVGCSAIGWLAIGWLIW